MVHESLKKCTEVINTKLGRGRGKERGKREWVGGPRWWASCVLAKFDSLSWGGYMGIDTSFPSFLYFSK